MFMNRLLGTSNSIIKSRRGFALLELVITLSLLGIILALAFLFFSFGINTYRIGEQQTDVQQNARMAADFIIHELRIAEKVVIVNGYEDLDIEQLGVIHDPVESPVFYIYLKDNAIYYHEHEADGAVPDGDANLASIMESISDNISFELSFAKGLSEEGKDNMLMLDLSATNIASGREYILDSQLLVLNLDNVEEYNLSDGTGTALVYQVPAPQNPTIERVTISGSDSHEWVNSADKVNIELFIETINVPDEKEVSVEFMRIDGDGSRSSVSEVDTESSNITDQKARFYLAEYLSLDVPKNLNYFGEYYIRAVVDCEYEGIGECDSLCGGLCLSQGRFYYIYPLIDSMVVTPKGGRPFLANVKFTTGGVATDTAVIIGGADMTEDDATENVVIRLYDLGKQDYVDPANLLFHQVPTIQDNGSVVFDLKLQNVDYNVYSQKELLFEVHIGRRMETKEFQVAKVRLTDLTVDQGALSPDFDRSFYVYTVEVSADTDSIRVDASLSEEVEDAHIKINDVVSVSREVLLSSGVNVITVKIHQIDDNSILNTYTITVNRAAE